MKQLKEAFKNPTYIAVINMAIVLIVAAQQYFLDDYNTFKVYKSTVAHFFQKLPLYDAYPDQFLGHFFYNPTFSLLFLPFAFLPISIGILAWGSALMISFYYGLRLLPLQRDKMVFVYFFSLISLVTAIQNFDTAPMVAAGIFATFVYVERQDYFRATLFPNIAFFVKGYAAIGACFMLMRQFKRRVFIYVFFWFSFFLLLPLIKYTPSELIQIYQEWGNSYASDRITNNGISLMGLFNNLLGIPISVFIVQICAVFLLILTMVVVSLRKNYAQLKFHFLAYILIWVVIFNHLAASSTYVIAMPGVAIWYLLSNRSWIEKCLISITFIFTVLSPTDLFPGPLKEYVQIYSMEAIGPVLVFTYLQYQLFFKDSKNRTHTKKQFVA